MPKCYKCGETNPTKFSDNASRGNGLQDRCKECHSVYRKQHYQDNRAKYIQKAKVRKQEFFAWWVAYKSQLKCQRCPENHPACLHFHHTNDDKEADVSKLVQNGCKEKVLLEVAKCIPLCANCHAKEHWRYEGVV